MDRTMMEIAADLLALSPLLEAGRDSDAKTSLQHLSLFQNIAPSVAASVAAAAKPAETPPSPPEGASVPWYAASPRTPSAPPLRPSRPPTNPLHEALRARAAQRLASFSSSRILRPKPLP